MSSEASISSQYKPSLVLDLDETLIFSTLIKTQNTNFSIRVGRIRLYIQTRPGLEDFFKLISPFYEIFIYTASKKEYANLIIDHIAPEVPESHRLFSDSIRVFDGYLAKDLRLIDKECNQIILVDNSPSSGVLQPKNFLGITGWYGEEDDKVLLHQLAPLLIQCANQNDIIDFLKSFLIKDQYRDLYLI